MKSNDEKRKRITATFSDPIFEKLEVHKRERGLDTYAECLNEIVELGFQKKSPFSYQRCDPSLTIQPPHQPRNDRIIGYQKDAGE